jgi:hypothetical protein
MHAAAQLIVCCHALMPGSACIQVTAIAVGTYWAICSLAVAAVFCVVTLHPAVALQQYSARAISIRTQVQTRLLHGHSAAAVAADCFAGEECIRVCPQAYV